MRAMFTLLYFASKIFSIKLEKKPSSTCIITKIEFTTADRNGIIHPVQQVTEKKYVLGQLVDEQHFTKFTLNNN
jgi:hypothetical protein